MGVVKKQGSARGRPFLVLPRQTSNRPVSLVLSFLPSLLLDRSNAAGRFFSLSSGKRSGRYRCPDGRDNAAARTLGQSAIIYGRADWPVEFRCAPISRPREEHTRQFIASLLPLLWCHRERGRDAPATLRLARTRPLFLPSSRVRRSIRRCSRKTSSFAHLPNPL